MPKRRWIALPAFLLWEAYWAYVFVNAPVPDVRMDTVFALLMAVFLPLLIAIPLAAILYAQRRRQER